MIYDLIDVIRDKINKPPNTMNYAVRTNTGSYTNIETRSHSSSFPRFEVEQSNIPTKYQEVARLASQITGRKEDRYDDIFFLNGIKNILIGY